MYRGSRDIVIYRGSREWTQSRSRRCGQRIEGGDGRRGSIRIVSSVSPPSYGEDSGSQVSVSGLYSKFPGRTRPERK